MNRPFAHRAEEEFINALEGCPASPEADALARFAGALRELPTPEAVDSVAFARGRARLLQLVEQRGEEKRGTAIGRIKGAAMGLAAIAGGGLVVAGAASGSNPVTLAVDLARDFSGPELFAPAPVREYSFEAEVVASDERTLEVLLEGRTIRVEPPAPHAGESQPEDIRPPSFEAGTTVRVTGREPAGDNVLATKIEVVPNPDKPSTSANAGALATPATTAAATKPAVTIKTATPTKDTGAALPTRTPTPKPSPTATPKPALTSVAIATAVAEPTEPTADLATPVPLPTETAQEAPRPDPKITAK